MRAIYLTIIFSFSVINSFSQIDIPENTKILSGFSKKISGDDYNYNSSIPGVKACVIARATTGRSAVEWETQAVPLNINEDHVTFVWLTCLGSSPGRARFDMEINGVKKISFWTEDVDDWKEKSKDGTTLAFKRNMIDQNGDSYGFMFLKISSKNLKKGQPLRLKVTGAPMNMNSWYMTYKYELTRKLKFKSFPAIITKNGKEYQQGGGEILYFGKSEKARIFIDNKLAQEGDLNFGYNYLNFDLPLIKKEKKIKYRMEVGEFIDEGETTLKPVKRWQVNLVQHTHTDIGYTRPQTEILAEHIRYIDYALDYCDLTDDYPEESKFRWTCEASWPVNEFLISRPESQIERLKKRVQEGRIEISGMYFNFDGLPDEQNLAASLKPIKRIRQKGMPVKVAMQNDVNGIGWCLNDYFNDLGIRYLNMGTHGHRALVPFDKPTMFWWESPSGKRMLTFRADHYALGNYVLKIHTGNFNVFENELLSYLMDLEDKGYKYDLIAIQHSGYQTDNSPPSTIASDMIRKWNKKYKWPKLRTATTSEFFEKMEKKYGDTFPVIRGAWPDWWTDGFGASAREVSTLRTAQADLIANGAGLTMAFLQGSGMHKKISDRIEEANNAMLFYAEHTVGYHGSVNEPFSKNSMEQRAMKESYSWESARRAKIIGEESLGLLQSFSKREKDASILVFNTLNWNRSGYFITYIDHQIIPENVKFRIIDQNDSEAKAQMIENLSGGAYWAIWTDDIPAFGFKKYKIQLMEPVIKKENVIKKEPELLENKWYKIKIDNKRGAISGIFDKEMKKELVDQNARYKLGEFIYEQLGNRSQMESFVLNDFTREPLDSVWFDQYIPGEIWNTVKFRGNTKAANKTGSFVFEIRLFNTVKRIDLVYSINKKMVTKPEGIYIAFPFSLKGGKLFFDVQGGEIEAGVDQVKGSANDWNTVQNYARLKNDDMQILLGSEEAPLMQFGGINTGRYKAGDLPETTHIFGWPMNNYWTTNYNAEQHGGFTWSYSIADSGDTSQITATKFGWGNRIPFLSRILPGGGAGDKNREKSFITGWPDNVLLVSSLPDVETKNVILHVREIGGTATVLKLKNGLTGKDISLEQVDVLGTPVKTGSIKIKPFESKFFRIEK